MTDQLSASLLTEWGYYPRQCPYTGIYWWGHHLSKHYIGIFYVNDHVKNPGWFSIREGSYTLSSIITVFLEIDYSLLDVELMPLPEIRNNILRLGRI